MTFIALVRDTSVSLATDEQVLAAEDVQALASAVEVGRRLAQLLEQSGQAIAAARRDAFEKGHAAGKAAGLLAARDEVAAELTGMAVEAQRQRMALQGAVARLAIQVVRKLAGEVGAPEMVAGLAQTAAADLLPAVSLTLRVSPPVVETVRARLDAAQSTQSGKPLHVEVRADETLSPFDCVLDTTCGTTIAGLDAQLARLEAALAGNAETAEPARHVDGDVTAARTAEPAQEAREK